MKSKYEWLIEAIPEGNENAKHGAIVSKEIGVSELTLRKMINSARKDGVPIIANDNGYFLFNGSAEDFHYSRAFVKKLRSHANEELETAQTIENIVKTMIGRG